MGGRHADHLQGHPARRRAAVRPVRHRGPDLSSSSGWPASGTDYRKAAAGRPVQGQAPAGHDLETPDDKTIVFHFKKPQPDLPYALAMAGYGAVPTAKDTKEKYDKAAGGLGPVQDRDLQARQAHEAGAATPTGTRRRTRSATSTRTSSTSVRPPVVAPPSRLMADQGADQTAMTFTNAVDPSQHPDGARDPDVEEAVADRATSPTSALSRINMDRVKDKKVREAIAYACPSKQMLQQFGGSEGRRARAATCIGPTARGYKAVDPFGKARTRRATPKKAKELLKEAGKAGMKHRLRLRQHPPAARTSSVVVKRPWRRPASRSSEGDRLRPRTTTRSARSRTSTTCTAPRGAPTGRPLRRSSRRCTTAGTSTTARRTTRTSTTRRSTSRDRPSRQDHRRGPGRHGVGQARQKILTDEVPAGADLTTTADHALRLQGRRGQVRTTSYGAVDPTAVFVKSNAARQRRWTRPRRPASSGARHRRPPSPYRKTRDAMLRFLVRRVLGALVILLVISAVTFFLFFALPADPARLACGKNCDPGRARSSSTSNLGLDEPVPVQYWDFMVGHLRRPRLRRRALPRALLRLLLRQPGAGLGHDPRPLPDHALAGLGGAVVFLIFGVGIGMIAACAARHLVDKVFSSLSLLGSLAADLLRRPARAGAARLPTWASSTSPSTCPITEDPAAWFSGLLLPWLVLSHHLHRQLHPPDPLHDGRAAREDHVRTARAKGMSGRTSSSATPGAARSPRSSPSSASTSARCSAAR